MGAPLELSAGPNSVGHRDRGRAEVQWELHWNSQPARTRPVTEFGAELRFIGSPTGTRSQPELGRSQSSGPSCGSVGVPLELAASPNSAGHRDRGRAQVQWESHWPGPILKLLDTMSLSSGKVSQECLSNCLRCFPKLWDSENFFRHFGPSQVQ